MVHTHVSTHPIVLSKVTQLRDERTPPPVFRTLVKDIATFLAYDATANLEMEPVTVRTPLTETQGVRIKPRIGIVSILRAGLGMVDAILDVFPDAHVYHLGLYRDEQTLQPVTYYSKLPPACNIDLAFVVDPMCATAGTAAATIRILKEWGVPQIKFMCIIASTRGIDILKAEHPDVEVYTAAVDSALNEAGYIVPGLGDAGDRQYNTIH